MVQLCLSREALHDDRSPPSRQYQDEMFGDTWGAEESAYMESMGYREAKREILGVSVMQSNRRLAIREDEAHARDARDYPTVRDCTELID